MRLLPGRGRKYRVLDEAVASQGRRRWMANAAAGCSWHSSCKSPRTLSKCKYLITKQLTFMAVRGGINLSSPSTVLKANHLFIRHLCFRSVRGDLQEGYFALPDANFLSSWCQFPFSRAQNRHFCALLPSETPVFGLFEHKIEVFVLFWPSEPSFSGFSSTKSAFLCSGRRGNCVGKGSLTSVNK